MAEKSLLRLSLPCYDPYLEGSTVFPAWSMTINLKFQPGPRPLALLPEVGFAHWIPFILLVYDLSTELILVLYCSTCNYLVDTYGCAVCLPPVSAAQPLLLDCLYVPLERHISASFPIKENSLHIWSPNSEGACQLEVIINCWAVTHFIVEYHFFLI